VSNELDVEQIGPFKVTDVLGGGAMGKVYEAFQPSVNRVIALKVLPKNMEQSPDAIRRFKFEAEMAAKLNHPNIVRVWDASSDTQEPPYYIAFQYLSGGTLEDRIRGRRLSVDQAVGLAVPLLHALDYAHGQGIVHRDIKPANIMFDEKGVPHLTDFGIAKDASRASMTVAGATFGTANYMSPEQARGKPMDGRSDLFSMAMVIYEMLAGRPPFVNDDPLVTMRMIESHEVPSFSSLGIAIPSAVESVLGYALSKDPGGRYQSGAELSAALEAATRSHESTPPADRKEHIIVPPTPVWLYVALGIVIVAIIGISVYLLRPKGPGGQTGQSIITIAITPNPVPAGGGPERVVVPNLKSTVPNPDGAKIVVSDKDESKLVSGILAADTSGRIVAEVFAPANTLRKERLLTATVLSPAGEKVSNVQVTIKQYGNPGIDEARDLVEPARERIKEIRDELDRMRGQRLSEGERRRIAAVLSGKCADAISSGQKAVKVAPGYRDAYWVQIQGCTYLGTINKDPAKLTKALGIAQDALRRFPRDKEIQDAVNVLNGIAHR
jgi:serine/threonine protein kinase